MGHEYDDRNAYPVPAPYQYEMSLTHFPILKRTYHEYCDEGGGEVMEADLQKVIRQMVPGVLRRSGLKPSSQPRVAAQVNVPGREADRSARPVVTPDVVAEGVRIATPELDAARTGPAAGALWAEAWLRGVSVVA